MMMITVETIRQVIENSMENTDRAERLFNALKPFDGKLLTQPVANKIQAATGETRISIRRRCGMTQLEVGGYGLQANPDPGLSFLMAYPEKNVRIDLAFVAEHNRLYLDAAKERNKRRRRALENSAILATVAHAIEQVNQGLAKFRELTEYGQPLAEVSYDLTELFTEPALSH